ncbi:MAG: protein kinase domain-containing protein [Myxococcaceae bacterium]
MADDRQKALEAGRALEKRGEVNGAVEMFCRAEAFEDAARVLSAARRFGEAGQLLMQSLGVELQLVRTLAPELKKRALTAAICFARANEVQTAVELFVALDERQRAVELLQKSGDPVGAAKLQASAPNRRGGAFTLAPQEQQRHGIGGAPVTLEAARKLEGNGKFELAMQAFIQLKQYGQAARLAKQLKRQDKAGELYAEAGMPWEAARCYHEYGDTGRALDNYVRVAKSDPNYRAAAVEAVRLSADLNHMGFQLEHFLTAFIADGPKSQSELELFYVLSKLYEKHDFAENAKEALRKLLAVNPTYRDAKAKLDALERDTRGSDALYARILKQDASFAGDGRDKAARPNRAAPALSEELPELPSLPDLPSGTMPPLGAAHAVQRPAPAVSQPHPTAFPIYATPAAGMPAISGEYGRSVDSAVEQIAANLGRPQAASASAPSAAPSGGTLFEVKAPAPIQLTKPATSFAPGSVIADRYRIEQKLGQGGMATVFRVSDLELGEEVALKLFNQAIADEQTLARFKQELRLSRQLAHPNVVRLFDIGFVDGHRFITLELLTGSDLKQRLTQPLPLASGIRYLQQACAGLQAAHDLGIVHRDVKPENFFVTIDDQLKVMDFGIAKGQNAKGLTVAGMIAGTPEYMSPEQINNFGGVTGSTDIYSLGVCAFEIFTGRVPFSHAELMPLLMMHVQQAPPAPRSLNPGLPPDLEAVILKAMAKQPDQRFASCRELAAALEPIRRRYDVEF